MTPYVYLKAPQGRKRFIFKKKIFLSKCRPIILPFLASGGVSLILFVAYSLFSYRVLVFKKFRQKILAPISEVTVAETKGLINPFVAGISTRKAEAADEVSQEIDYDLVNNWFPTASIPPVKPSKITHYALSIPKLKIENAVVEIGGAKVKKNLVHYPGTALPGDYGNGVIFGHSILPIFYDPKDYKAIFSLLPTLEKEDRVHIFYDGIEYIYEVVEYREVKPEEIDILEQRLDQRTVSLVTCVPPGTYLRRGIVRARLLGF